MKHRRLMSLLAGSALLAVACSGGTGASPAPSTITEVGEGEGQLTVLAWPGYVEDGTTSPDVDWVTPFEEETGCEVTVQTFGTSSQRRAMPACASSPADSSSRSTST
jgi:putative spermidine/putrescine transport system substrate-binding protein